MKKKHLYWIIPSAIVVILVIFYLLVPSIAKSYIQKKVEAFSNEKNAEISISELKVGFLNLHGAIPIEIASVELRRNHAADTLLYLRNVQSDIRIFHGFHITKDLQRINCDSILVHIIKNEKYNNYDFLFSDSTKNDNQKQKRDYNKLSQKLLEYIDEILPQEMLIKSFKATVDLNDLRFSYDLPNLSVVDGKLSGTLSERCHDISNQWKVGGFFDHTNKQYSASMTAVSDDANFALTRELKNAEIGFQKMEATLAVKEQGRDESKYHVSGRLTNLLLNHRYLAESDILIDSTAANLDLTVFADGFSIDSSSVLCLNEADVHPYFLYEKKDTNAPHVIFRINEQGREANKIFGSLPESLFQVLPALHLTGHIDFGMNFDCDFSEIDSLDFDFHIGSCDHSVAIGGDAERINRFNAPFEYVFYENGDTLRVVTIGPSNPYFCPFEQIPPYLTKSILASEDAGFFNHCGFIKSAIEAALVSDIKAGKLRRGGSTLTMQLVKNLFLNRKKVFSRKFEEMVLVWLIESHRLITKERMFEIYVNIVEWAPGVIGIGEASQFYFDKKPQELTFGECLYLATLIRAPKHYASTLNDFGEVRDSKREELVAVANRMVDRGIITAEDLNNFNSFVVTKKVREPEEETIN